MHIIWAKTLKKATTLVTLSFENNQMENSLQHFRNLEKMYESANINQLVFSGSKLEISEHSSRITFPVLPPFQHALEAMHGCVYFKLLDDACYFSAASSEVDFFILTKSFTIQFLRPHNKGIVVAEGRFFRERNGAMESKGTLWNESGKLIAKGSGVFVKSNSRLKDVPAYWESSRIKPKA